MNKKNLKIIQFNGAAGIILTILLVLWILGSIIIFPVYGIKFLWNTFIATNFDISTIKLSQAALLWGAVLVTVFAYLKNKIMFKMVRPQDLPTSTINSVDYEKFMEKIKKEQNDDEKINH